MKPVFFMATATDAIRVQFVTDQLTSIGVGWFSFYEFVLAWSFVLGILLFLFSFLPFQSWRLRGGRRLACSRHAAGRINWKCDRRWWIGVRLGRQPTSTTQKRKTKQKHNQLQTNKPGTAANALTRTKGALTNKPESMMNPSRPTSTDRRRSTASSLASLFSSKGSEFVSQYDVKGFQFKTRLQIFEYDNGFDCWNGCE